MKAYGNNDGLHSNSLKIETQCVPPSHCMAEYAWLELWVSVIN